LVSILNLLHVSHVGSKREGGERNYYVISGKEIKDKNDKVY
jgi:hypothetical protein